MEKKITAHKAELLAIILEDSHLALEWSSESTDGDGNGDAMALDQSSLKLQEEAMKKFTEGTYSTSLLYLGFSSKQIPLLPSLDFFRKFALLFVEKFRLTPGLDSARGKALLIPPPGQQELATLAAGAPFIAGAQYLDLPKLWGELNNELNRQLKEFKGRIDEYLQEQNPEIHLVGKVFFHLVENKDRDNEQYPFAFLATYSQAVNSKGEASHLPLKHALEEHGNDSKKLLDLLITVYRAGESSTLIKEMLETGEIFHPISFTAADAFQFLQEITIYEQAGILCRIPNWWKNQAASTARVGINIGPKNQSILGLDSILKFKPEILLAGESISESEAKKICASAEGLALIKGKWIAVDHHKLQQVLELYKNAKKLSLEGGLSFQQVLKLELGQNNDLSGGNKIDSNGNSNGKGGEFEISRDDWLSGLLEKLRNPALIKSPTTPSKDFCAKLRPYQQSGLNWLYLLHTLKLGACLADDMGLGKTIQVLAFLDLLKTSKNISASLLVLPTSLIANWESEIKRFAPKLNYFVIHQGLNSTSKDILDDKDLTRKYHLVISTYGLIHRYDGFKNHLWSYILLDEAQAIKNPNTKQTKAVKSLRSFNRIVLTGTPIENRLSDLWSIYDFINPGLLGTNKEFSEYVKKMSSTSTSHSNGSDTGTETETETGTGNWTRLRKVITPYLLRRLKTDKAIISDLPDKIEMKSYAELSKKQILLYQEYLQRLQKALADSEGIKRKGLVLASLLKLKQICNHPDQYLGNNDYQSDDSGKFQRLAEICETISARRERVLVFTQFQEITPALNHHLQNIFKRKGLVLHGAIPPAKRKPLIEKFQSGGHEYVPYFILSLKAGGVGLNLTAANHVIHFDRWWNPAVENQATDRAYRIGQNKKVVVHKFICKGTLEERIDKMIEEKIKLSKEIIHSNNENWITEMNNEEIMGLFKLSL
ncbi:MAG: DEAD/DEAH box helicase [Oligoflexia bacterium]|nr:DEAD/DEAH box helicase [Oligoflexia bacterium]